MPGSKAKKILFMSATSSVGGAEAVVLSIARHIDKNRFRCVLLTQKFGPFTEKFDQLRGQVFLLPLPAWRKVRYFFSRYATIKKLVELVRREKIDIIHCNNYRLNPYAVHAARECRIPAVTHLHDFLGDKHIRNFLLPQALHLLAVSAYITRPFRKYALPIKVIHNGIPTEKFFSSTPALRKELGVTADVQLIGIVGTFTEEKRHTLFLQIAAQIKPLMPTARFVIVGDDVWNTTVSRDSLKQKAQELGIEPETIFLGWRQDIPEVMSSLDAILLTSVSESFPLVVLEAMAAGAIVFAHEPSGGPGEAITNGQDGFLVDCVNVSETARKVVEVLSDTKKCAAIRQAAREKVRQQFDIKTFIKNIENSYDELTQP